mmetsp:Transcript_2222/g.7920  ORF Transcript_2222/g.7920 Transcript_2222/m.7920 type:complete len:266 (+) Transcript_2222:534-1331(+)
MTRLRVAPLHIRGGPAGGVGGAPGVDVRDVVRPVPRLCAEHRAVRGAPPGAGAVDVVALEAVQAAHLPRGSLGAGPVDVVDEEIVADEARGGGALLLFEGRQHIGGVEGIGAAGLGDHVPRLGLAPLDVGDGEDEVRPGDLLGMVDLGVVPLFVEHLGEGRHVVRVRPSVGVLVEGRGAGLLDSCGGERPELEWVRTRMGLEPLTSHLVIPSRAHRLQRHGFILRRVGARPVGEIDLALNVSHLFSCARGYHWRLPGLPRPAEGD